MVSAVVGLFSATPAVSHAISRTADTLRGSQCADSRLYSQLHHCSQLWRWRRRLMRKFPLASVFPLSVLMATMTTRHTVAPRLVSTDRATSITASFWAWAHGPVGA